MVLLNKSRAKALSQSFVMRPHANSLDCFLEVLFVDIARLFKHFVDESVLKADAAGIKAG